LHIAKVNPTDLAVVNLYKENTNFSSKGVPNEIKRLYSRLQEALPGLDAQLKAAPLYRGRNFDLSVLSSARQASVLWLMFPGDNSEAEGVLIERGEYDGVHSKQIAMPGGETDPCDCDYIETALRECEEELGVKLSTYNVLGALTPLYIPPSNFMVRPYVAWVSEKPVWSPDKNEVANVLTCKMSFLSKEDNWGDYEVRGNKVPGFMIEGNLVWGATAMILSELMECWSLEDTFVK